MVNRTGRIKDPHEDLEVKLLQIKFEEIFLRERLKKNQKEFEKYSKKLLTLTERGTTYG